MGCVSILAGYRDQRLPRTLCLMKYTETIMTLLESFIRWLAGQYERWLFLIATGCINDIATHRVRVAMPFNPHSVDQKEIHHER